MENTQEITIFTDGSVTSINRTNASVGCGVLIMKTRDWTKLNETLLNQHFFKDKINTVPNIAYYGEITEHKTSYAAELTGVYQALLTLEKYPTLEDEIILDNEAVVNDFTPQFTYIIVERMLFLNGISTSPALQLRDAMNGEKANIQSNACIILKIFRDVGLIYSKKSLICHSIKIKPQSNFHRIFKLAMN